MLTSPGELNPLKLIDRNRLTNPIDHAVYDVAQRLATAEPDRRLETVTVRSSNWNYLLVAGKVRETYVAVYGRQVGVSYQLVTPITHPTILLEENVVRVLRSLGRPRERLVVLDRLRDESILHMGLGARDFNYDRAAGIYAVTFGVVEDAGSPLLENKLHVDLGVHQQLEDAIRGYHHAIVE